MAEQLEVCELGLMAAQRPLPMSQRTCVQRAGLPVVRTSAFLPGRSDLEVPTNTLKEG